MKFLHAAEIDRALLPALFESPDTCGNISPESAELTGLAPGTPVVAGAGDQAAGAVGMGIVAPGAVSATIGTSGVVFAATDRPVARSQRAAPYILSCDSGTLACNGRDSGGRTPRCAGSAISSALRPLLTDAIHTNFSAMKLPRFPPVPMDYCGRRI